MSVQEYEAEEEMEDAFERQMERMQDEAEGEEKTFKVCAKITMDVVTEVQAGPGTGIHPDDDEAIRKEAISQIFEENYDPGPLDCDPKVQWVEEDEG